MRSTTSRFAWLLPRVAAVALGGLLAAGCGDEGRPAPAETCEIDDDCLPGQVCILGHCASGNPRDLGSPRPPPPPDGGPDEDLGTEEDGGELDLGEEDLGMPASCGDMVTTFPEDCDPPTPPTCDAPLGCSAECTYERLPAGCGNGCPDTGEECGDTTEVCAETADCVDCRCVERCGNGMLDGAETCGEPGAPACEPGSECRDCVCYTPGCGNGFPDTGEDCGEPGLDCPMGATCVDCGCIAPGCGNGIADEGEDCGEPVFTDCAMNHECTACRCVRIPMCGDGYADPGEECGEPDAAGCAPGSSCIDCGCVRTCGNGMTDDGEVCGEPGLPGCTAPDACSNCACTGRCGNGVIEGGEKCGEPGLACAPGSGCDLASCRCTPLCGNGRVDAGETCDPPSTMSSCSDTMICTELCQLTPRPAACGNGCTDAGEECGDGLPADSCAMGETCGTDSCTCVADTCGNATLDAGEVCDGAMLGTAQCPAPPGGGSASGTASCTTECVADVSQCSCGAASYIVTDSLRPTFRRDVWEIAAAPGSRLTYSVDVTGTNGFDPVACLSTTSSSADCFSRSDDAFECTAASGCGAVGCPRATATLPPDPDSRYYLIIESWYCSNCFSGVVAEYTVTVSSNGALCRPTLTAERDLCAGSGGVTPGQEACTCP